MEFTINQIAQLVDGDVAGDGDLKINMLGKIQEAGPGQISFLSNPKYESHLYSTQASAVIVKKDFLPKKELKTTLVRVDDPYATFTQLLEEYHKTISFEKEGIEEPSFLGKGSTTGDKVYRGAFSYIGENVQVGNNVKIYPHAYIGDHVVLGDNTIVYSGAKLYAHTKVGKNCVLHSGAIIGSDGFGFAPQEDGAYKAIPQLGNVVLEDNVSIGANTVVDCSTFYGDATLIKTGVKLDNLIQVAHNVQIGENTVMAAQSGVSGSTEVGKNCVIGGQVGIAGHIKIKDKTSIAAQSGIGKSIKRENTAIMGSPAFDLKEYYKSYAVFKSLPDFNKRLKQLEEKILNLPSFDKK